MQITNLRTNHVETPIGYWMEDVSLSWMVEEAKGIKTLFEQIKVAKDKALTDIVYDSGKQDGSSSLACVIPMELEEGMRYYWNVTIWDDADEMGVSETTFFETAKKVVDGNVIKAPFAEFPIFTRTFELSEDVQDARVRIIGLGLYEFKINGKKVGEEYLTPYYNDYSLWLQYQTYDVTSYLQAGINRIEVMLGDGWYKGRFGVRSKIDCLYGDTLVLLCELTATLQDGTIMQVQSDENWSCTKSPILKTSIYDGEEYDSRLEIKDWDNVSLESAVLLEQEAADEIVNKLLPRMSLPVTAQERIKPIELIKTPAGEDVLDFGQIMTGILEFQCDEAEGQEVFLQFGEILQGGNFYNDNLRTAKEEYRYISNGEKAVVRHYFTFYGFRFVKVTGISNINLDDFTGVVLHSEMERTGNITTSNDKVNRLFLNALWGQKGNFLDVPTDCPQRDERLGWTGDAQAFCATASFNMYTPAFFAKYMYDMKQEQKLHDGCVPDVVPDVFWRMIVLLGGEEKMDTLSKGHKGSCAWGDAATIIPWSLYRFYGDKALLEKQYDNMKMWTDYIKQVDDTQCGSSRLWTCGFHYADWLALDTYDPESRLGGTDCYYVASAYYLYSSELTAKAAEVLGYTEDAKFYTNLANEVRCAMQKEYFTATGRLAIETQTAMVLALHFHIVPEEFKERLKKDLKVKLEKDKVHLTTGFVGTAYLCLALAEHGLEDYAYSLLLNEDYPSWLYEVNMGATTVWERWNSVLEDGSISSTGMNSLNHYAYGAIVEWMYRYMGGINPIDEYPGFKKFVIKPYADSRFGWANVVYKSTYGNIESAWEITEDSITYTVKVPFDTQAEFILRNAGTGVTINGVVSSELQDNKKITLEKGSYVIKVTL